MVLRSPIEWTPLKDTTDKRTGKGTCLLQMGSTSRSDVDDVVVGALRPGVSLCPSVRLFVRLLCVRRAVVKQNGDVVMTELSAQMEDAAAATTKAYANLRHLRHMEKRDASNSTSNAAVSDEAITERAKEWKLPAELRIMQPVFRFLQLLCENHNAELQVCGREIPALPCCLLLRQARGTIFFN